MKQAKKDKKKSMLDDCVYCREGSYRKCFECFQKVMKNTIDKKPSWNLANVGAETFKQVTDIKTFIQKVKEDVEKQFGKGMIWEVFNTILDKNAGDL